MQMGVPDETQRAGMVFDKISAFEFHKVVEKYRADYLASHDTASAVLLELKRWLTLCVMHPEKAYGIGGQVDDMWHTFILFTKDYARFCEEIAGTFIHHSPEVASEDSETSEASISKRSELFEILVADYSKYFGSLPPTPIWPGMRRAPTWDTALGFLEAMAAARA